MQRVKLINRARDRSANAIELSNSVELDQHIR